MAPQTPPPTGLTPDLTWKATQTEYILAADQEKEAVRSQMDSRVVSPWSSWKSGWLREHWYWSQAITK